MWLQVNSKTQDKGGPSKYKVTKTVESHPVEMKRGIIQVKWQSILLFQKTAGYSNQLLQLTQPLNSRPAGTLFQTPAQLRQLHPLWNSRDTSVSNFKARK